MKNIALLTPIKTTILSSTLCLVFSFCTFAQEEDLRDLMVGEYSYTTVETYSHKEGEFTNEGEMRISKADSAFLKVEMTYKGDVIEAYLIRPVELIDTIITIEIPKRPSPHSKYYINQGKGVYNLNSFVADGLFYVESKKLKYTVYTDKVFVKKSQTKIFECLMN